MASAIISQNLKANRNLKKQIQEVAEHDLRTEPAQSSDIRHEPPSDPKSGSPEPVKDPSKALDQTLALLRAKDDTSRFVGLALLKPILDNKIGFREDAVIIERCWAAIPARFIDRLLRAAANKHKTKEESSSMVELAVAVLHAFIVLLPISLRDNEKLIDRVGGLVDALTLSPLDTSTQILQILVTIASTQQGSRALLHTESWPQLVTLAPQQDLALDVVKYAFLASFIDNHGESTEDIFNTTIGSLVLLFRNHAKDALFSRALHEILTAVPIATLSSPSWLSPLAHNITQSYINNHNINRTVNRHAFVLLAATLIHMYPSQFSFLLFNCRSVGAKSPDSTPNPYLFIKLLLVDIKASIPSLQENLNLKEYPATSTRLASSYDIISAFVGFLVQTLDEDDIICDSSPKGNQSSDPIHFPPSLLLQLRADICETLSLTIEHLRDRFDSSTAGAAGLHPSARSRTEDAPNAPLSIAWDSSSTAFAEDPLTVSQLRALGIWLREDDNDAFRKEAAGIMDLLLNLYNIEKKELDFRSPVLLALEGIITTPEGIDAFLAAEGWTILTQDLHHIITNPSTDTSPLGIDIVRVLLAVAESDVVGPAQEEWMSIVTLPSHGAWNAASRADDLVLDLRIAVAQLAVELLVKAPRGVRRRYMPAAEEMLDFSRRVLKSGVGGDAREGLEEVVLGLEGLDVGVQI